MRIEIKKRKNLIIALFITALAIGLCCVFAACSKAQASSSLTRDPVYASSAPTDISPDSILTGSASKSLEYSDPMSNLYSQKIYTREKWLADLMKTLDLPIADRTDIQTVFLTAYHNGIIDDPNLQPDHILTRRFVAQTLVKALGYSAHDFALADVTDPDSDLSTVAYYGYFLPDDSGNIDPDALITEEEYHRLITEVSRYHSLSGKTILAFGDSIMYGSGNHGVGIADLLGEKYHMTVYDYSVSGATFGYYKSRSHIPDQIRRASGTVTDPDIILLNGGTNDMEYVAMGSESPGYEESFLDESTFAGGFEYASLLLQTYWHDTPVLYIRAHNMDTVADAKEQRYGTMALELAEKWSLSSVDIYSDSDLCTEKPEYRNAYTSFKEKIGRCDGIHPTALGYSKFYLPLIEPAFGSLLGK